MQIFSAVLDAERVRIEAADRVAQTETQLRVSLVAIYKALGGGWEVAEEAGLSARDSGAQNAAVMSGSGNQHRPSKPLDRRDVVIHGEGVPDAAQAEGDTIVQ